MCYQEFMHDMSRNHTLLGMAVGLRYGPNNFEAEFFHKGTFQNPSLRQLAPRIQSAAL